MLRHPKMIVLAFCLATAFFVYEMKNLAVDPSVDIFVPKDHPEVVFFKEMRDVFGLFNFFIVGVVDERDKGVYRPDTLQLVKDLSQAFAEIPGVVKRPQGGLQAVNHVARAANRRWLLRAEAASRNRRAGKRIHRMVTPPSKTYMINTPQPETSSESGVLHPAIHSTTRTVNPARGNASRPAACPSGSQRMPSKTAAPPRIINRGWTGRTSRLVNNALREMLWKW